mmetsp:Transcript_19377/g.23922  ORF Transcript_19377/g.23922 Transcript_19377/m.23922 type:complete len:80 (+) Transcript_19377:738-977(+)
MFGPFKQGDPLHTGHNKCIGARTGTSEEAYMEEMEQDPVQYRKNVRADTWRGVTNGRSMMNATTLNNFKNINRERSNIF